MSSQPLGEMFKLVVSDKKENKLGIGATAQKSGRSVYYFASREAGGDVHLQALNGNGLPAGERTSITFKELIEDYHPEPLFYYNKVKPLMDELEADLEKGERNLEAGRADLAEKCFKRALEVDAENIRGIFGLGTAYLQAGKTAEAEAILGRIMNLEMAFSPEHAHLFNQFGIRMRKAGMLPQALGYYAKAADLNRGDEHLHFNICRIHYEMDDLDAAFGSLETALALNQEFKEGWLMREHLLKRKPELANAAAEYQGLELDDAPCRVD